MKTRTSATAAILGLSLSVFPGFTGVVSAQWTALTNAPPGFLDTCLLLTDGRVMCHEYGSNAWHFLTPDINGSYANGTWSASATMPDGTDTSTANGGCAPCTFAPVYFASVVLADGRVVVIGGEYNTNSSPGSIAVWSNIGFMYDPQLDTWSAQLTEPFGTGCIGDASAIVLEDGTMLLADGTDCTTWGNMASFDPATLTFTALNPTGKADRNNEENWNLLPDGTFITVDARIQSQSEIYDPDTNTWGNRTNTVVNLADTGTGTNSREVGPGVLRPDGTLVYFSGTNSGQNAVYDFNTGTWSNTAAMDFPLVPAQTYHFSVADGPASLLPNGDVLVMASPVTNLACGNPAPPPPPTCGVFNTPSHFYEFDFSTNTLAAVTDSPNAASFVSYQGRMLLLPTGEVLLTAYDQNATQDVLLYSNGGAPQDAWRPTITSCLGEVTAGATYSISGTLFNGLSEGASYGDDAQMSTNYPLVRIRNIGTGHVFYARTHDHSRMGIQALGSTEIITTQFDTPVGLEAGPSELVVVVNGIASNPPLIINDNHAPTCDANGPYAAECEGVTTSIQLDGSGSSDPDPNDDLNLAYLWTTDCPGGTFDDDTIESPMLTVDSVAPCPLNCTVSLTVTDCSGETAVCAAANVTVDDTTDPVITCPDDVTITCGESTDPADTGMATAVDDCDAAPVIDYSDVTTPTPCPADPIQEVIDRTWTAVDACTNDDACTQEITILKLVQSLAIKQGACPAPLNRSSRGILPMVLHGESDFNVEDIDLTSLLLSRTDCVGGAASPNSGAGPHIEFKDLGHPFHGSPCDCDTNQRSDGIKDLSVPFRTDDVVAALELDDLPAGEIVELTLSGRLNSGCEFIAVDCVKLVPPAAGARSIGVVSNVPGSWIEVQPLDLTMDGGGFSSFKRFYSQNTTVLLRAPASVGSLRFKGWRIDGVLQSSADPSIMLNMNIEGRQDYTAEALYQTSGGGTSVRLNSTTSTEGSK